jgi:hypothetical protein
MWGSFLARLLLYSRDFVGDAESLLWCPRTSAVLVAPVGDLFFFLKIRALTKCPVTCNLLLHTISITILKKMQDSI